MAAPPTADAVGKPLSSGHVHGLLSMCCTLFTMVTKMAATLEQSTPSAATVLTSSRPAQEINEPGWTPKSAGSLKKRLTRFSTVAGQSVVTISTRG